MQINLQFSEREYLRPQVKGAIMRGNNETNRSFYFVLFSLISTFAREKRKIERKQDRK
jgi:hypothetical protein